MMTMNKDDIIEYRKALMDYENLKAMNLTTREMIYKETDIINEDDEFIGADYKNLYVRFFLENGVWELGDEIIIYDEHGSVIIDENVEALDRFAYYTF